MAKETKKYWTIFWALFILTVAEVGVTYLPIPYGLMATGLVLMAVTKASLVGLYFMHLIEEKTTIWLSVGAPVVFGLILFIGLMPDIGKAIFQ